MNHHRRHADTSGMRIERLRGFILALAIGAALGALLAVQLSK